MKFVVRTGIASLVLLLLEAGRHLSWQEAASALLVCAVLCWVAERSQATGVDLVVALGGFYFILVSLTTIPEGVLFDVINVRVAPLVMVRELGIALAIAITIAALFEKFKTTVGTMQASGDGMTIVGLLWRMAAAIAAFLVVYWRRDADLPTGEELLPRQEHARSGSDGGDGGPEGYVLDYCRVAGAALDSESQRGASDSCHGLSCDRCVLLNAAPQRVDATCCALGAHHGDDAVLRALRLSVCHLVWATPCKRRHAGSFSETLRAGVCFGMNPQVTGVGCAPHVNFRCYPRKLIRD